MVTVMRSIRMPVLIYNIGIKRTAGRLVLLEPATVPASLKNPLKLCDRALQIDGEFAGRLFSAGNRLNATACAAVG